MDAATLQNRIYKGYGKAALRLGLAYSIYRPANASDPLATVLQTLPASFNAEDFGYKKPNKYGTPTWYAILDGSVTKPGDYLQGAGGTFFIAAQQLNLPILVVECNRTLCMKRQTAPAGVGAVGYGGATVAASTDVLGQTNADGSLQKGWPASVLLKGKADTTGTDIPSATKNVGWFILLPPSVPITLQAGDILVDDLGRRYGVQGAELTDLGWRLMAREDHA